MKLKSYVVNFASIFDVHNYFLLIKVTSCDFYIWVVVDDWHELSFIDVLGLDKYDICCLDLFLFDHMLVSLTKFFWTFFDIFLHAFIGLCADVCAH